MTLAPPTVAPVESVIVPSSVALTACPNSEGERLRMRSAMMYLRRFSNITWDLQKMSQLQGLSSFIVLKSGGAAAEIEQESVQSTFSSRNRIKAGSQ
jgi:hypothetical protein